MNEWPKRPDGTPVTSGPHRRVLRSNTFWQIVGAVLALIVVVVVIYLYFHRPTE